MNAVENRDLIWKKAKPFLDMMKYVIGLLPKNIAKKIYEKKRFKTGWINMAWRYVLINRLGATVNGDKYVIIQPNVCIYNVEKLVLGEHITINDNTYIECKGGIEIGDNVMIGHGVSILSNSHGYENNDIPMNMQQEICKEIKIGNNVWIGAKVTILMGVTIGDNVIIGANALVNKDIPSNAVVAGVPARIIRTI